MTITIANILEAASALITLGGAWRSVNYFVTRYKVRKNAYRQSIIDQVRNETDKVCKDLETKIEALETELQSQKANVEKDMGHMKEIYNAEIKVLGDKIEDLRQDLQAQHSSTIALLTKLVDGRS